MPNHVELTDAERRAIEGGHATDRARDARRRAYRISQSHANQSLAARLLRRLGLVH